MKKCIIDENGIHYDDSLRSRDTDVGVVDKVFCTEKKSGNLCKVRIRSERFPEIGDKFGSRHGQKGTIGFILPKNDMPFTRDGLVPDIILNPHAFPSRQTLGHFIECVLCKGCAELGLTGIDATPFANVSVKDVCDILEKTKFEKYGNEKMYN